MCDNFLFQIDKSRQQTKLPFFVFLLSLTFSDIKEAAQIPLNQFIIKKPQGFFNTHEHNFVVNILLSNRCIGTYNISIETHFAELISNALYYRPKNQSERETALVETKLKRLLYIIIIH